MGFLLNGVWSQESAFPTDSDGRFVRPSAPIRHWVTADGAAGPSGEAGFKAEKGRYHLYISLACPWAHRTLIFRKLKGLEGMIGLSVVHWHMAENGWTFADGPGVIADPVHHARFLHQVYTASQPDYTGRVTVPVLWDLKTAKIVNNESSEIIRMFNSAFDGIGAAPGDYYPEALRGEIDALNERIYTSVNNGVYRAGFARSQGAYDEAVRALFSTLDWLEEHLAMHRWLCGESPHRSRLAAVHHADPLRSGLCRPFQMQHPPHRRLPQSHALFARALCRAGHRRNRQLPAYQGPLLPEPSATEPERHRAGRSGTAT